MITLTEAYVDSLALNAGAIKNGRDLVRKNSFPLLCQSEDDTLLFGECKGSGKEPYRCSADFIQPDSPTFRCSCPSRQFPCKHLLGLMYSFAMGKPFAKAAIPQEILDKREKAEKREEKKKEAVVESTDQPRKRKTNKSALIKKIAAQLEGIEFADKLLTGFVQSGLGGIDKKTVQTLGEQGKQLGNYYIPGIQSSFQAIVLELNEDQERESMYTGVIPHLISLHSLLKKSREHLISRKDDPDQVPMETASTLEEAIGHAWTLAELREVGLTEPNVELLQLSFRSYSDPARKEYVDEGYWIQMNSGIVHATRNYRPYRAAKYIREEDSIFQVVQTPELFVYPGELNARVRYEDAKYREALPEDFITVQSHAHRSFADVVKKVKNQIKNPLSDKNPVMLLAFREMVQIDGQYALVDEQNKQIPLADIPRIGYGTTSMLPYMKHEDLSGQAMLVMFQQDFERNRLTAQPLSLITATRNIRLLY